MRRRGIVYTIHIAIFLLAMFFLYGCNAESSGVAVNNSSTPSPKATSLPSTPSPTATSLPPSSSKSESGKKVIKFLQGTTARYLVQEQLARLDFPIDAIGETNDISGSIVVDKEGILISHDSKIVVNLKTLRSDESRRDRYIRNNSLESNTYPEASFTVKELVGLPWPYPQTGEHIFKLAGEMTVHGITRPLEWSVKANFEQNSINGRAETRFTFGEFNMQVPRLFFIISVEDDFRLELDFIADIMP